jgi:hypothetical protein
MTQTMNEDMIERLAKVISKAWFDQTPLTPEENWEALQRLMYCRRQRIRRKKASQGGSLNATKGMPRRPADIRTPGYCHMLP